jgi:hypothetical protein
MTGRRYYLTTFAAWQLHASGCAESHFIAVAAGNSQESPGQGTPILALITADEAAHIALEADAEFEPLPHPLARTAVSERVAMPRRHNPRSSPRKPQQGTRLRPR